MGWGLLKTLPAAILWAGWTFLIAFFLVVLWNLLRTIDDWGGLFVERPGERPHLSRYLLLFGSVILALNFLVSVIRAYPAQATRQLRTAFQVMSGLDVGETVAVGITSVAYLLARVTNGQILTLFGRSRSP